jgi:hypothetical protein
MLYHPKEPDLKKRIDLLFDEMYRPEVEAALGDEIKTFHFFTSWKKKREAFLPKIQLFPGGNPEGAEPEKEEAKPTTEKNTTKRD